MYLAQQTEGLCGSEYMHTCDLRHTHTNKQTNVHVYIQSHAHDHVVQEKIGLQRPHEGLSNGMDLDS